MSKKIREFLESDSLSVDMLVNSISKGVTGNGATYLSINFQDNSATIDGKYWDVKAEQLAIIETGKIFNVNCEVIKYRGSLQLKIHGMKVLGGDDVDLKDYVICSPVPTDVLKKSVKEAIKSLDNKVYADCMNALFKEVYQEFFEYPAATKNHHNFLGGLATHVVGMINIANEIVKIYNDLNRDLLISGVLLHDIGKIYELSGPIATEYTVEGKLLGHISIMQAKLSNIAITLGYDKTEEVMLMRHMILAHHGKLEYGSPVLPLVLEAELLFLIDNMDARINSVQSALSIIEPGEFTPRLFPLENRAFYKPKG